MSAYYSTQIEIKGTKEEAILLTDVLKKYQNDKKVYLEAVYVNKKNKFEGTDVTGEIRLDSLSEKELVEYIEKAKGHLYFRAGGPYGKFAMLEEVDLLQDMSEMVPSAYLKGWISGADHGVDQEIKGKLSEGKLTLQIKCDKEKDVNIYDPIKKAYISEQEDDASIGTLGEYIEILKNTKMSISKRVEKAVHAVEATVPYDKFLQLVDTDEKTFPFDWYQQLIWNYYQFGGGYSAFNEFCSCLNYTEEQFNKLYDEVMSMKYQPPKPKKRKR